MKRFKTKRTFSYLLLLLVTALLLTACADQGPYSGAIAYQRVVDTDSQIFIMDPQGEVKTPLSQGQGWDFMPAISPDGDRVAYYRFNPNTQMTTVYEVDLTQAAFEPKLLTDIGIYNIQFGSLKWSPDSGSILYASIDSLDISDIYIIDVATGTVRDVFEETIFYDDAPDWSPDGSQFVFASNRPNRDDPLTNLYLADPDGQKLIRLTDSNQNGWVDTQPSWSPYGEKIAFWRYNYIIGETFEGGPEGVWLLDLATNEVSLLYQAQTPMVENPPAWSSDGRYLAFLEILDNQQILRVIDVNSGELVKIDALDGQKRSLSWSPDSRALVFSIFTDPSVAMFILDVNSGEFSEILEEDPLALIGDPHWGGQ